MNCNAKCQKKYSNYMSKKTTCLQEGILLVRKNIPNKIIRLL